RGRPSGFWQARFGTFPVLSCVQIQGGIVMPTLTIEYRNDAERLAYEQAIAFVTQLHQVAATEPDGNVLAVREKVAAEGGRELLCNTLAAAVQQLDAIAQQIDVPPVS